MPEKGNTTKSTLPSNAELSELVEELVEFERDVREWQERSSEPPARSHLLSILAPRRFVSIEQIAKVWDEICSKPAYTKLQRDPNFSKAVASFEKVINPRFEQKARFLGIVAFYISRHRLETEQPNLIKQPDAKARASAIKAAEKLQKLARLGARLDSLQDREKLETLLWRLVLEMKRRPEVRTKNDTTFVDRLFVKRLARSFLTCFGEPLTSAIESLAMVVGYKADDRNIGRAVSEARREHDKQMGRNALARALMKYP